MLLYQYCWCCWINITNDAASILLMMLHQYCYYGCTNIATAAAAISIFNYLSSSNSNIYAVAIATCQCCCINIAGAAESILLMIFSTQSIESVYKNYMKNHRVRFLPILLLIILINTRYVLYQANLILWVNILKFIWSYLFFYFPNFLKF